MSLMRVTLRGRLARTRWPRRAVLVAVPAVLAAVMVPVVIDGQGPGPALRLVRVGLAPGRGVMRPGPGSGHRAPARPSGPPGTGPAGSPSPVPTSRPSPSPSPSGSPSPVPSSASPSAGPAARLAVQVTVSGVLGIGLIAVTTVTVSDPGTAATARVSLRVTGPAGTVLLALAAPGWSCGAAAGGSISCRNAGIAAGGAVRASFRVLVASLAGCGQAVTARAVSGARSARGESAARVTC